MTWNKQSAIWTPPHAIYPFKNTDFFFYSSKKRQKWIFSKFFKLSGDGSYQVWTGLGVLFRPQNTFLIPLVVFEKNRFFAQKSAFLPSSRYGVKNHFFGQKIDFFKILQTFRGWFLAGSDRLGGVVSPLKPFYITTRRFSEKSIFWSKKCIFTLKPVGVENPIFLTKKSIFSKCFKLSGDDS